MFSTDTGDEQGGLEGSTVPGARCIFVGARSFVWDPCLRAKHLNCPFIIVSDFSSVLACFLPTSYPVLPFNPPTPRVPPSLSPNESSIFKRLFF